MRVILFILASVIFQNIVHSQNELSELERRLIKSQGIRVKEQWDFKYSGNQLSAKGFISSRTTFDMDGRVTEVVNFRSDTVVMNISTYAYNTNGQRTEYVKYKGNKTNILYKQVTQYNNTKQKISEIGFNGVENFKNQYTYDAEGKQSEIRYFTDKKLDELRTMAYKANQTEMQVKDASGNILSYLITKRDDKDRVIEESRIDNSRQITEQTFYTYDSRSNILVEEKKYPAKPTVRTEYIYDKFGKLQDVYSVEGNMPRYLKQSYSYSSNGFLLDEFWKNSSTAEQSFRKYNYDNNGRLMSTDCYFASYKYKVLNKFVYQTY